MKKISDDIEKLKQRSFIFGVIIEDKNENEIIFTSTLQQIAHAFFVWLSFFQKTLLNKMNTKIKLHLLILIDFLEEKTDVHLQ